VRVHSLTVFAFSRAWDVTPGLPSWPATLRALALIASPKLGLRQNPLVEGKYISRFQVEGVQISTPHTNNTKGLNRSTNNHAWTFQYVSLLGLNSTKKQKLDKKWAKKSYEANILFNVVWHWVFIEAMKATFESQTYYKPPSY